MSGPLTVFRHKAMACDFEISLNSETNTEADTGTDTRADTETGTLSEAETTRSPAEVVLDAFDEVDRLESVLSIFRNTTELSRLNLLAGEMNVTCSQELFSWLLLCRRLWQETNGAFDITSTPLWEAWGFARHEGRVPSEEALTEALTRTGMDGLLLDEATGHVAFTREGLRLNFGGIGKGLAVDAAAAVLRQGNVYDFLLHGGRSSVTAEGGRTGQTNPVTGQPCWTIGLSDPYNPNRRIGEFYLSNRSLGTSGSQYQFFRYKGKRYPHIIDPRSGQCVMGRVEVCVTAPDATTADALSTAFFVQGPEWTEQYCQHHPETGVVFLLDAATIDRFRVVVFGLDKNQFRLF